MQALLHCRSSAPKSGARDFLAQLAAAYPDRINPYL
ncbi:hypothetical protein SAMN04488539_1606 [Corynebacterium timonense]|uniref:Uncharacterized protein n=1 Tax=Corynebacterium timonense TaxID=441500 RepID=A0A1H1RX14_9CORY|nr:hypothetical protein SAMN04488539_1606 [Corynebacterium timonense]